MEIPFIKILKIKEKNLFNYLFLAVLSLYCYTQIFSSCGKQGLFFIAVASLVSDYRL